MGCKKFLFGDGTVGLVRDGDASPPGENECQEVVNSNGRACRKCKVDCYRKGWLKPEVDRDNARFVAEKHQANQKER